MPFNKLLALAAKSQTSLDFARLRVTFRRWRGITVAVEYSANFIAYNGNIKEKPAPSKLQLKAVDIQGVSEDLFEVR